MLLAILKQVGLSQTLLCLNSQLTFKQQLSHKLYQFQLFSSFIRLKSFPVIIFWSAGNQVEIPHSSARTIWILISFCAFYGWCVTNCHCHGSMTQLELHNMTFIIEMLSPVLVILHLNLSQYWYWETCSYCHVGVDKLGRDGREICSKAE